MACLMGSAIADDNVTGSIVGEATGTEWTMKVRLNNETTYCAFQMDVQLPAGVSVSAAEAVTERLATGADVTIGGTATPTPFVVIYNTVDAANNIVRIVAYNMGNNEITGNSGDPILQLTLTSTESKAYNDITATFSGVEFVKKSDLAGEVLTGETATGKLLGDANGDGKITITDAVGITNFVISSSTDGLNKDAADLNNDGKVTITDAVCAINIVIGAN